jgi:hypothetical protein
MRMIAMLLVLYAVAGVSMSAYCDENALDFRQDVNQAAWTTNNDESPHCCETCFCCSILILPEQYIPTTELRVGAHWTALRPVPPPSRWRPLVYHPPKVT